MLKHGAEECVVDDDQRAVRVRASDLDRAREIRHAKRRIGRRLDEDQPQIRESAGLSLERRAVACGDRLYVEAERLSNLSRKDRQQWLRTLGNLSDAGTAK